MAWKGNTENPAPNNLQFGSDDHDIKKSENRAHNIRRDQDSSKNFTVQLEDIDTAIFSHLDNSINIHVLNNGTSIKVPIQYASQEKWKSIQKDGVLRDQQGKIQLPVIVFSRTGFVKNAALMTLNRHLSYSVLRKFDEKNRYDRFPLLTAQSGPVHQVLNVALPDHIDVTYEFVCWSEYIEQLNTIVQKVNFACEEYWGDPKRFKFRVYSEGYAFETVAGNDDDRAVKATFSLKVKAYLLEESFENRQQTTRRSLTPRVIKIGTETVSGGQMQDINKSLDSTIYKKPVDHSYKNGMMVPDGEDFTNPSINGNTVGLSDGDKISIRGFYENLVLRTSTGDSGTTIWYDPPAVPSSYGQPGWMAFDGDYHYIYINGSWRRHAIEEWERDF